MPNPHTHPRSANLLTEEQREQLVQMAARRRWGRSLMLVGWLHLLAFSLCYYLTQNNHHDSLSYLAIWVGELLGVWVIFRVSGGPRPADPAPQPLECFVQRVWIAYFVLAFNLCSLNTLRGHFLFEFFPAMASLASFAFIVMSVTLSRRFFAAVLVMFASGLLMAAFLLHAFLIFAVAWWLVLNVTGLELERRGRRNEVAPEMAEAGSETA
ncbi:MAG: hypothetical protein C5B56_08320 [Proteobacteria bacterium]|nr:MAG: hypothetical protein C5B56_08320 [Pseudomonadota bacterium]